VRVAVVDLGAMVELVEQLMPRHQQLEMPVQEEQEHREETAPALALLP
jgi:hypothetical protein